MTPRASSFVLAEPPRGAMGPPPRHSEAQDRERVSAALGSAPLFGSLPDHHRAELARLSRVRLLTRGEALWHRNQPARELGLVLAGRLKSARQQRGRPVLLDVHGPGDVLGETAFAMEGGYQTDVICLRRARVLLIPAAQVHAMLAREPKAALALALDLAAQLLRLVRTVEDLNALSVERRLARALLRLAERVGEPFPGGVLIPLRLTRADLASLAATTLESSSRKLSEWQRQGWVVAQPAGTLLRNVEALRALVADEE